MATDHIRPEPKIDQRLEAVAKLALFNLEQFWLTSTLSRFDIGLHHGC